MRVAMLTRYDQRRASSRVRAYQYAPHLARLGVRCRFLPWANRPRRTWPAYLAHALALARWADVVVLQKPFHPPQFVNALVRVNPRVVVDIDDAVWEPIADVDAARATELGRRLDHAATRANVVLTGSAYLAERLRERNPGVDAHVLPSSVELTRFPMHKHTGAGPVVIGWIGSPENLPDLEACRIPLARLVETGTVRLRVVSSEPPAFDDLPAEFLEWVVDDEPRHVAGFDVGIMPLRDTLRTRGRCGFKAVEYMAAGVPVVASALRGPSEVVEDGVTGFVVEDEDAWEDRLVQLTERADLRARLGLAGRAAVGHHYSAEANAPHLAELLASARGDRPGGTRAVAIEARR